MLDADDEYQSDDDEGLMSKEFQETVREILLRVFIPEEQSFNKSMHNFKRVYKAKFSA